MANFGDIPANQDQAATFAVATARGQILGSTNSNAFEGNIGQITQQLVASGSAVALSSATPTNVASVSLTPGSWIVHGSVTFKYTGATQSADAQTGFSGTTATLPGSSLIGYDNTRHTTTTSNVSVNVPTSGFASGSTQTVYLVAQTSFSAGSCAAFGSITAVRCN